MKELILFSIANTLFILKNRRKPINNYFPFLLNLFFSFFMYHLYLLTQVEYLLFLSGIYYLTTLTFLLIPNWQFIIYLFMFDLSINIKLLFLRIRIISKPSHVYLEQMVVFLNLTERYHQSLLWSKKLLAVKKTTKTLNHNLYSLLRLNKFKLANDVVDEILIHNQNNSYFLTIKADVLFHLREFNDAIVYYDRLLKFKPRSPEILYNKGKSYANLDDLTQAEKCYKASLSANPLFVPAYTSLVKLYLKLNLKDNATKVLEDFKKTVPHMSKELKNEITTLYREVEQL